MKRVFLILGLSSLNCGGDKSIVDVQDTNVIVDVGVDANVCNAGMEKCQCYGNNTCNDGLSCFSNLCVKVVVPDTGNVNDTNVVNDTSVFNNADVADMNIQDVNDMNVVDTNVQDTNVVDTTNEIRAMIGGYATCVDCSSVYIPEWI